MYSLWEKLEKREKALLVGIYAASLVLAWTLGYGWGRSSSASRPMQAASVHTQGSVEVIDLSQPPPPTSALAEPSTLPEPPSRAEVVVHVSGAVKQAGVYRLAPDSRVADAIEQAGGATKNADLDALNLAEPIQDGQKIHVPRKGEVKRAYNVASVSPSRTPRGAPQAAAPRRSSPSTSTPPPPINWKPSQASVPCWRSGLSSTAKRTAGSSRSMSCWRCAASVAKRLENMRPYVVVK
jgi:DNA uptake protein ComE-like DNA-binding protein